MISFSNCLVNKSHCYYREKYIKKTILLFFFAEEAKSPYVLFFFLGKKTEANKAFDDSCKERTSKKIIATHDGS